MSHLPTPLAMKILISAYSFFPKIGGIETFTDVLATTFVNMGHTVIVMTPVEHRLRKDKAPYTIIRKPSPLQYLELFEWCDIFYQSNVSLRMAWPLLLVPKPLFITHHIWPEGEQYPDDKPSSDAPFSRFRRMCIEKPFINLKNFCKDLLCSLAHTLAVSSFMDTCFNQKSFVLPNMYQDTLFYRRQHIPRRKDLIFVGRLVKEKGLQCALEALKILKAEGYTPTFSVVGLGKERDHLEALSKAYGLDKTVTFLGALEGEALAESYCQHSIQLIPSLWPETFGLVALEGIACGCVPIGSEGGGLKNTIGPCGLTFPNGNARALAAHIRYLLDHPEKQAYYQSQAKEHLEQFSSRRIAEQYIDFFKSKTDIQDEIYSF